MLNLLKKLGNGLKRLVGLLLPMFSRVRAPGPGSGLRWVFHVALVVLIIVLLGMLHQVLGLQSILPGAPPILKQLWLPLLFLLVYALCWLVWWFYQLLQAAPEASPFPDIDRAWDEAMQAIEDKGLDLTEAPLFLLLGRPNDGEEALFDGMSLVVPQSPRRPDAPLHVYAGRDAIYITCVGASLLGEQAHILAGEVFLSAEDSAAPDQGGESILMTLRPGQDSEVNAVVEMTRAIRAIEDGARAEGREANRAEKLEIRRLQRSLTQIARPQVLHDHPEEVARSRARLHHLGRLIARRRRPFCGLNGVLLMIPMSATDNDLDAHEAGTCCQEDLATVREATQVRCPVFALVCDLEQLPGYDAFIAHFPDPQRGRIGRSFPLAPDIPQEEVPSMIESGMRWLGLNSFPAHALPHWRLEMPGVTDLQETMRDNGALFHFLSELRERQAKISRILIRGVVGEPFGGCYIAGTGRRSDRDKAFLRAVFAKLVGEQDHVAWTPEALAEEDAYRRMVFYGYRFLAVVLACGVVTLGFLLRG